MTLVPLPAFADNYIWMLQDGRNAIVVDPGEAKPVFNALERGNLQLAAILVTHHHLRFAQAVEPDNPDPTRYAAHGKALRARGEPAQRKNDFR